MEASERLLALLRARGLSLGVAESLTGGGLCSALVAIPGASDVLRGGVVSYATEIKQSVLGVDAALLERFGPVHPDVAVQMAEGVRRAMTVDAVPADMGIATTGIAGPDSPDGQPVGTVHIGVSLGDGTVTRKYRFAGDRAKIREAAIVAAIEFASELLESSREYPARVRS